MNAAARLMQPLQTHLKPIHRFLQHASNTQRTQALARHAQRTAQHARRCSRTCTFFTRPRVTRSIIHAVQRPVVLYITCTPAGAVASRRHAVATQPHMTRTGTGAEYSANMNARVRGGGASSRRRLQPGNRCAKIRALALMSSRGLLICARICAGDRSLPLTTRSSNTRLQVRQSVNERDEQEV
jgi:hypothetical protein